jgi:hypothetical protein
MRLRKVILRKLWFFCEKLKKFPKLAFHFEVTFFRCILFLRKVYISEIYVKLCILDTHEQHLVKKNLTLYIVHDLTFALLHVNEHICA